MRNDDMVPVERFPLPDGWSPAGVTCVLVPCPDDPQYLETLVGAIARLGWSTSFARDETKTGAATVARTWNRALLTQAIVFEECDMKCCDDPIVVVPPYNPGGGTGPEDAAGSAIEEIFVGLIALNPDCSMTRSEYIETATAYMRGFSSTYSAPGALGAIYDQYCLLPDGEKPDWSDPCKFKEHYEDIVPCFDAGGLIDDLNCLSEEISEWLTDTSEALMTALNQAAAALTGQGWQAAASSGGAGFGGGFAAECSADWCHEVDFVTDDHTGDPLPITMYFGDYHPGAGWSTGTGRHLDIRFEFAGFATITYMEIEYTTTFTDHADGEFFRVNTQHGTWIGGPLNPYGEPNLEHLIHSGDDVLAGGRAPLATGFVQVQIFTDVGFTGQVTVSRWKVCGTGINPFA